MHDQACYTHTHIVRHRYKRGRHTRTHTVFHTQYNMHIATTTTKQHHVQRKPHVDGRTSEDRSCAHAVPLACAVAVQAVSTATACMAA